MINPTTADIGRRVYYHPKHQEYPEYGTITSFNDKYVFVRYENSGRANTTSKATLRKDLNYAD